MAKPRLFCFAMERPEDGVPCGPPHGVEKGPPENSRAKPLPVRTGCRPIALWKAVGRSFPDEGNAMSTRTRLPVALSSRQPASTMKRVTSCGAI